MTAFSQNIDFSHPAVVCKGVSFSYIEGREVIKNLNLTVGHGEKIGIIGPNGAGKSTLLTLLNGLRQFSGEISVFGVPVEKDTSRHIKTIVGLIFQNPDDQLFSPTFYEDIAFGPLNLGMTKKETEKRVKRALEEVGLPGYEERFALHLSFGERKLVAIATILSMTPEIIAMDEPTSNLDPAHRRKIINWIKMSTHTLLITSHDLDMVLETCGRIVILNSGRQTAEGKTAEILTNKNLLEENNLELPLCFQHKHIYEDGFSDH